MSFGDSLRTARKKKGFTQQQVANAMGLSKSTYCGYETGKRQPDVPKLKMLSKILGVSGDALLETGYEETPIPVSESGPIGPAKQALIDAVKDMDDSTAKTVLDVVKSVKKLRGE